MIKEAYIPELIREVNRDDITQFAAKMSFKRAKIVLGGYNILAREDITQQLGEAFSPQLKDKWFRTAHRIFRRP